jgi:hypothetical protein
MPFLFTPICMTDGIILARFACIIRAQSLFETPLCTRSTIPIFNFRIFPISFVLESLPSFQLQNIRIRFTCDLLIGNKVTAHPNFYDAFSLSHDFTIIQNLRERYEMICKKTGRPNRVTVLLTLIYQNARLLQMT